jgi:oligosaccharide repeat unit polymerase
MLCLGYIIGQGAGQHVTLGNIVIPKVTLPLFLINFLGVYVIYSKLGGFNIDGFVEAAVLTRADLFNNDKSLGTAIFDNAFVSLALLSACKGIKLKDVRYFAPIALCFLVSVVQLERARLIMLTITLSFLLFHTNYNRLGKGFFLTILFIISAFIIIGTVRGSFATESDPLWYLFDKVLVYIVGGFPAFSQFFENSQAFIDADYFNTFPFIAKVLNVFGLEFEINNYKYTLVYIPQVSNIFTGYRQIFQDFGLVGSLLFSFMAGLMIGFLEVLCRARLSTNNVGFTLSLFLMIVLFWLYIPFYSIFMFMFPFIFVLVASTVSIKKLRFDFK